MFKIDDDLIKEYGFSIAIYLLTAAFVLGILGVFIKTFFAISIIMLIASFITFFITGMFRSVP